MLMFSWLSSVLLHILCLFGMSGVPSFLSCAFLFFVYVSEGRKEGCLPHFESELATVG